MEPNVVAHGSCAPEPGLCIHKQAPGDKIVALAGNPNVGKSTLFNSLTGMRQHTGNWPGKTVGSAQGFCKSAHNGYVLVDIPGTYSLLAHSAEEEIARNFICFSEPDAVVVVCDATCLARNLQLALQVLERTRRVIVCVNLMDEAKRKGIHIDLQKLSKRLGVPVVGTSAQKQRRFGALLSAMDSVIGMDACARRPSVAYSQTIEQAIAMVEPVLRARLQGRLDSRWLALRLLEPDASLTVEINACLGDAFLQDGALTNALQEARALLLQHGIQADALQDGVVSALVNAADALCQDVVTVTNVAYDAADRRIDRVLTGRLTGYPIMVLLLGAILWLTITGANVPSALLADGLFRAQAWLSSLFLSLGAPSWLHDALILGVYRTLAWVISVMLPPMAIFFPLFTLLEDAGYLPRIAFNLDKPFQRCKACGKQALTMWVVDKRMRHKKIQDARKRPVAIRF